MGSYKRTHTVEEQSFVPDAEIEMKIKHGKEVVMQKSCTEIFRIATLHFLHHTGRKQL